MNSSDHDFEHAQAVEHWERAEFPFQLINELKKLDLCGGMISGYGCPVGLSATQTIPKFLVKKMFIHIASNMK